ncbi:MAG: SCO family protein [Crocinitomicaceae bacterium]
MKRIFFLALLFLICVPIGYYLMSSKKEKPLPIINPIDVNEEMVDPELLRIGFGHHIGAFRFLNQNGKWITDREMKGKVSVVEYFFTTCKSICPIMNQQMQRVHSAFIQDQGVKIFSFTVDPEIDTVEQLKRYAESHQATPGKWHFLTGNKADLYALARKSFFVLKPAEAQNLGDAGSDFIHTNNFVLIDKNLRIRGYYDGTSLKEVNELISDIKRLQNE